MAKRSKKAQKSQANLEEFAIVAIAEDLEQAREYESLLKINDIPVIIKQGSHTAVSQQDKQSADSKGIAVMVPEDYLDEAHVIIESHDAYDDFFDFALEEEEEEDKDIDSSPFDDEF